MGKTRAGANPYLHLFRGINAHFGAALPGVQLVSQTYEIFNRPNIHLAIEKLLSSRNITARLEGIILYDTNEELSLAKLTHKATAQRFLPGPVEYNDVALADGQRLSCVKRGIYWIKSGKTPLVLLLNEKAHQYPPAISVEVLGPTREAAEDFGRALAAQVLQAMAFRGHVLSLETDCYRQLSVRYHTLPRIARNDIILPEDVLSRIDRQAMGMARHASRLRSAGRHLKRGILLHGPPGTGKTLSAMYLAGQMPGRTVLVLTGGGMSSIETSGVLARTLAPVTIILEDVDLIGTMREHQTVGANALLFELLNQMDGLAEDADVLFVLTSNRPDALEPALASRPGRIDQAIEISLPDADCRRRLIELYATGIDLRLKNPQSLLARTEGASAAFIRELLRRATVLSLERDDLESEATATVVVQDQDIDAALSEITLTGGRFAQSLLGHKTDSGKVEQWTFITPTGE